MWKGRETTAVLLIVFKNFKVGMHVDVYRPIYIKLGLIIDAIDLYIHPRRRNVTTSMVGLENSHIHKNLTKNGELQRYSWGMQKKKNCRFQY